MFLSRQSVETYGFGHFRLDLVARELSRLGEPLPLPAKTFDILRILVENSGRLVTKEELFSQVWANQFVEENNLTVRVSTLRKALGEGAGHRFIETVSGCGYRFASRVRVISARRPGAAGGAFNSLAVLPLTNENNQQRLDYLCDGVTESLINSLSQLSALRVMSRSAVFRYKGRGIDPLAAGRELGVGAVLAGGLSQVGNSLVFRIEVIDVGDGSRLWGATLTRRASDLLALQGEVAGEVSDGLRLKLDKSKERRVARRYTGNLEAYHLYLKGRYFWNKRSVAGLRRSIEYFRRAIKKDPQYALAHSGLADAYLMVAGYGLASPRKIIPKAQSAALRALEIDDRLEEAHVSLGAIKSNFEWDWVGAEQSYRRAIELSRNNAAAHHYYSALLARLGRLDQAVGEIRKAFEIDPLSLHVQLANARILYFAGQYHASVKHCKEILEINPEFGPANGVIGLVYLEQKRYGAAIEEIKKLVSFSEADYTESHALGGALRRAAPALAPDTEALGVLGYAYGVAGERGEALKLLKRLRSRPPQSYVEPHSLALVYLGLEDGDQAFEWLEKAFAERSSILTYLRVWPVFNRIRNDSRYQALVERIGVAQAREVER